MSVPLLNVQDIVAGYVPGLPIVHGVSLNLAHKEIVTIIGPNGAGKSTLLKAIAGLVPIESGTVSLGDRDLTGLPASALVSAGVGFVPQTGNVFSTLTIQENLTIGGHTLGAELKDRIETVYARFPFLSERRRALGRVLSGGQRQMLAIARALMTNPRVVMLDEPTAGLSPKVVGEVFADLRELAQSGVGVLMVEQNAKAALRISDRGYVLADGRNWISGPALDLLDDPEVGEAFLGGQRKRAC